MRGLDGVRQLRAAAHATFDELDDPLGLALCARLAGNECWMQCQAQEAAVHFERAAQFAERAGSRRMTEAALMHLGTTLMFGPEPRENIAEKREALLRRSRGGALLNAGAARNQARLLAMVGEFDEARRLHAEGLAVTRESGMLLHAAAAEMGVGFIELHAGDYEAADIGLRGSVQKLDELGDRAFYSTSAMNHAFVLIQLGRYDEARRVSALARERSNVDDLVNIAGLDAIDGALLAEAGDHAAGVALAQAAVARGDTTDFYEARTLTRQLLVFALRLSGTSRTRAECWRRRRRSTTPRETSCCATGCAR